MIFLKYFRAILFICLSIVLALRGESIAFSRFNDPVQVTSNPGQDFAPAVSPDGKLLVYVSDQSGNLDLWLKYLDPAVHLPDRRLTFHTAEDNAPAFSPDGKSIVFVSHRSDPRGDIYVLPLEPSKDSGGSSTGFLGRMISGGENHLVNPDDDLLPLTDQGMADADPVWSPDGNFIYYSSLDSQTNQMKIYKLDLKTKSKSPVVGADGGNPAISPEGRFLAFVSQAKGTGSIWVLDLKENKSFQITEGQSIDLSPRWSADGKYVYFVRYFDDTNFDGRITIDDRPGLWRVEWGGSKILRQLTSSVNYDLLPALTGQKLYFTSTQKKGTDIWSLPLDGVLPYEKDYGRSLQALGDLCPDTVGSYPCLMAYRNVIQEFGKEKGLIRVRYLAAKEAVELGNHQYAREMFSDLIKNYPEGSEYKGLAEIELLLLETAQAQREGMTAHKKRNRESIAVLEKIIQRYASFPRVAAKALLEKGDMHLSLEESDNAMQFYKKVINEYPGQRAISAEAAYSQSKVYSLVGDQEKLVDSFIQVVRDYHDVEYWTRKSIKEILNLFEKQPTMEKKVSSLHNLTVEYKAIPLLAASVQNRIGEIYYSANENLLAKEAYKRTIDVFSKAESEKMIAQFALAKIYAEEENYEMSLSLYQQISENSQSVEENVAQAKKGYIRKSVEKGLWELKVGEVKLAAKTFLKLIEYSPQTTVAHRGYIQSQAALKKMVPVVEFYKSRIAANQRSAVDHYALGLAYTYLEPPDLSAAEREVGMAIVFDSQDVYFHQTLGWLYEQKERSKKNAGYLENALQEYQAALMLNDDQVDPDNRTNLLLNMGNGHYLLKNYLTAYYYYRERSQGKIGLTDENREAIYYQRFGESAFKVGFPAESVELYQKALKRVSEKNDPRIAELNDRIALAYQDGGQYAKAVEYFSKTLELHQSMGNTASTSKALRNIANNLYSLSQGKESQDAKSLNLALSHYYRAIEDVEKYGVAKKSKEKSALIDVNIETALDADASQAAAGFDKSGEQKLIFNYIGRIYGDFGKYDKAIEYFQKKLALIPKDLDPKKHIPSILEKAIILNQIGNYYYQSGKYAQSAEFFKESYQLSKLLGNHTGVAVNSANIARLLLTRCELEPIQQLRGEMESTLTFLEESLRIVDSDTKNGNPVHSISLKNYIGILHHYFGVHFPASKPAESGKKYAPTKDSVQAALLGMQSERDHLKISLRNFEDALALARKELKGATQQKFESGLRQNLELTRFLAGSGKEKNVEPRQDNELLHFQWQFKYLQSLQEEKSRRLAMLVEAEKSLSRLPYGLLAPDPISRTMMEELYLSLTETMFDQKRYQEALHYSEKGTQQLLISLRQDLPLKFKKEESRKYHDEVKGYASRVLALSNREGQQRASLDERRAEMEKLLDDYSEFIALMREDDRYLAALFSADVPQIHEVFKILGQNDILLKYQKVHGKTMMWFLSQGKLMSGQIHDHPAMLEILNRLRTSGAQIKPSDLKILSDAFLGQTKGRLAKVKTVYILGNGDLEFLPWSAMTLDGSPLVQSNALSHLTSLAQLTNSQNKKNLYNSRMLAVGFPGKAYTAIADRFASALNMTGDDVGMAEQFQGQIANYGVVSVESKTVLRRLIPENTYVSMATQRNHFEQVRLEDWFSQTFDANFIALDDVEYDHNPDLGISPTAPLLEGLLFAGYPSVLMHIGEVDPKIHAEFIELFYGQFRKGNPAESLRFAQMEIMKRYPGSYAWASYRLYGFPGMGEKERNEFARKNFNANVEQGGKHFQSGNWMAAIASFEKALGLMDMMPDKGAAPKIYKVLAQAAYNNEDFKKAIRYQMDLVSLAEKKNAQDELAEAIYFLGILYSRAEDYPKAVAHLQKALAIYQKNEMLDKMAESYSTLGIVEENALDYDKALEAFSASLSINEEIGEEASKGKELRRIGRIYLLRLSNYRLARKYFTEANELFKKIKNTGQVVETLLEIGLVNEKEGDFASALKMYQEAQLLTDTQEGQAGLSKALLYQANAYWFQGDYQNAFKSQKHALEIAESLGDKRQQTFIFNTLGLIYWTLNDSTRALANLNRSLELAKEIHSSLDIASAYNNIGLVYRKDKKYPQSIEYFQKALEGDIQIKSKWGQGYTHRNLGMSYIRMGQLDQAEKEIAQAIALSGEIGDRTNLVKSKLEQGHLAIERKAWDKAVLFFQETRKLAEDLRVHEVLWRALRGEGYALVQLRRMDEAVQAYKKAVDTVDQMRAAIKVEEFQNGFLTDKQDVYKELVLLLLDKGKVEEAFVFTEKAKSRSFIDLLGNQKINLKNEVSRNLYNKSVQLKQKIREIGETLAQTSDAGEIKQLKEQLVSERNRYQDLLIEIKSQSPEVSSFVTVETLNLQELYALLENDVALVEYLITEKELVAWVISKGKIDVVRTSIKESDLVDTINDHRKRIQQLAPVDEQSMKLYEWVIKPAEGFFKDKRVIGIVPHGHLHYVSFATLRNAEGYLIEKHPLFYTPSASILKFTFKRKFEKTGPIKVLALGNPDLKSMNYDLPLAEMEANSIKWDFSQIDVLTRENATESWVQKHVGEYQIIHIASHGEFDPVNPLFSSLKLTSDADQDGSLQASEVFALNINADLVTLSACQTGLGDIVGGDELVGLNRAFIYAGTHAIISSLWRVSDISTAVLIKHLYRNYVAENKGESLRKAQLLVKKSYPHPSYWAGFTLTGDYR